MGIAYLPGLIYLLSIPALVIIYYFSRKKKQVEISSIIPWRLLRESVVRSSLFRADLLFFLQLLLLLILVAAACRPCWKPAGAEPERGRHVILVLDRSASMQANEGRRSRWEMARERALAVVRKLGPLDRITVLSGEAGGAEILTSAAADRRAVEALIGGLGPADTPDRMAPALELALAMAREAVPEKSGMGREKSAAAQPIDSEIFIFTDRSAESLGLRSAALGGVIHLERVGSPKANTAVTEVSMYGEPFSADRRESVYATVENFSRESFMGKLSVAAAGRRISSREISIPPGEARTIGVSDEPPEGLMEITLEPSDALPLDNRAYALPSGKSISRIVLFTREGACAARLRELAAAVPNLQFEVMSPTHYASANLATCQVAIFHRCEPEQPPSTNFLLICPPPGGRIAPVLREWVSGVSFLDWNEDHPIGRNLRGLQNVGLSGSRIIETPPWARAIVTSATTSGDIPLVVCGGFEGRRAAVMSFDLCEIELGKASSLPALILLLNTISWLGTDDSGRIRTGEPYAALVPGVAAGSAKDEGGAKTACTVINPRGQETRVAARVGGLLVFRDTDYAGRYLVTGGAVGREFVANLFDRDESNLEGDGAGDDKAALEQVMSVAAPAEPPPDRSPLFLWIAALVLAAEWLLWSLGAGMRKAEPVEETAEG